MKRLITGARVRVETPSPPAPSVCGHRCAARLCAVRRVSCMCAAACRVRTVWSMDYTVVSTELGGVGCRDSRCTLSTLHLQPVHRTSCTCTLARGSCRLVPRGTWVGRSYERTSIFERFERERYGPRPRAPARRRRSASGSRRGGDGVEERALIQFKVLSCFLGHNGVQGMGLRTVIGLSMPTPPIDIIQRGSSNPARRIDLRRAQHAKNIPHAPLAPCAPSTA